MTTVRTRLVMGLAVTALLGASAVARAEDISGTILRTFVLSENSRLVGDVTCNVTGGPCFAFGVPNIVLSLNGFTITGPGRFCHRMQGHVGRH